MEEAAERVLAEFEIREETERKVKANLSPAENASRYDQFLHAIGRPAAQLLDLLIRETRPKTILELGCSYGYSTIWLAAAARAVGGRVISLELHSCKVESARAALARAGLDDQVEIRLGDAREIIPTLSGPFDFVLLDLCKDHYVACFDLFSPKLSPGALVIADNMLSPPGWRPQATRYRAHVHAIQGIESVLLPVGGGLEVSRFAPDGP